MTASWEHSGQYISVESRRMHVVVSGTGTPVVFEAGAGEWSAHWTLVTAAIGGRFQCISYDRAGLGWSEPAAGARSAKRLSSELIQLLDALGISKPAILVAHSFGASIARLVASISPDRVCGIVFVDGWHESFSLWERENAPAKPQSADRVLALLERFGAFRAVNRLLNWVSPPKCPWPLPAKTWASILAVANTAQFNAAANSEASAYEEGDLDVAAVTHIRVPIVNLVASHTISPSQVPSDYPVDAHNAAWLSASSRLSNLSSNSVTKVLTDTDHMIQLVRPEAVVEAIVELEQILRELVSGGMMPNNSFKPTPRGGAA